jgi:purine operon repressor
MKKFRRNQRVGALMKIFAERPNHIFSYNYFSELFNAAKSTISEDVVILKGLVNELEFGRIETISGASGGVIYIPSLNEKETTGLLSELCLAFSDPSRIIPGGYIYMTDIFNSPYYSSSISKIIASQYSSREIDIVVTVETKGIPTALMTAKELDVPLAVVRRNTKVTEGTTLSINYVSGSTKKIESMTLSRRAIKEGSKVLIVDDFMKGGGTAKGVKDLMAEFNAEVMGIYVVISTKDPENKLVKDYNSLLILEEVDEENKIIKIRPNIDNKMFINK